MSTPSKSGVYSVLDDGNINARADFFDGLGEGMSEGYAGSLGTIVESDSADEDYRWLGTAPSMSVWEGEALLQQLPNYAAILRNVPYLSGLRIEKKDIDRDKTGQIRRRISGLGQKASRHWEQLISTLIGDGETATGTDSGDLRDISGKAYDGQAFFDTDHSYEGAKFKTNQSNDLSAGVWDVATATTPTADEAALCVLNMVGNFYSLKDDQGDPINGGLNTFRIMVGTVELYTAYTQAVGLQNLTSGATNPVRALDGQGLSITVDFEPRLSAKTTKVYGFATGGEINAFILQDEDPITVEEEDPGILKTHINVAAKASRAAGYGLWQRAVVGTHS
ncbi:MAG: Mu-like prophage major head subunit gpT family protein [Planctomycetota bacterium]